MSSKLDNYDQIVNETALMTGETARIGYSTLNLTSEAGEVAGKFAKALRDGTDTSTDEFKQSVLKELGDVLWCVSLLSTTLGSSLDEVLDQNAEKVLDRQKRGVTTGSGDDR